MRDLRSAFVCGRMISAPTRGGNYCFVFSEMVCVRVSFANSLRLDRKRSRHLSRLPARSALLPYDRGLHRRPAPPKEEAKQNIKEKRGADWPPRVVFL